MGLFPTFSRENKVRYILTWQSLLIIFIALTGHEIAAFLEKDKRVIYAGFDPTASSLHIGNLLVIMGLLHAQKAGHQSLALIGGATARIGDPSGKSEERPSLTKEALDENVKGIKKNLNFVFKHFESIHGIEGNNNLLHLYFFLDKYDFQHLK